MLHSLGASGVVWRPVLEALAAEREVVALDLPGFGASPELGDGIPPSAANLADAVLDFCEELGLARRPHVAGISHGGWVAIECARQGRARSVTALCPAGFWSRPLSPTRNLARGAARALLPLAPLVLRTEAGRRLVLRGSVHRPERVPAADAIELVRSYARSPAYPEARALMRGAVVGDISGVPAPITLAWAEFDGLIRPPRSGTLPGTVRQVTLTGCGHLPTWDDSHQVARVILEGSAPR